MKGLVCKNQVSCCFGVLLDLITLCIISTLCACTISVLLSVRGGFVYYRALLMSLLGHIVLQRLILMGKTASSPLRLMMLLR